MSVSEQGVEIGGEPDDIVRCLLLIKGAAAIAERFDTVVATAWIDPTGTSVLISGDDWNTDVEHAASKLGVDVQLQVEPKFQRYVEVYYEPRGANGPDDWFCFYRRP